MKHTVIDFLQQECWTIMPYTLDWLMNSFIADVLSGKVSIPGHDNRPKVRSVINVRILPVVGRITKRMNLFTRIIGGTSTELLKSDIQAAIKDPEIKAIVLDIDSPGGMVDGIQNLQDFIFKAREKKPIVAFANGLMASGATWIGSAASKIFASEDTAQVGSIGVIVAHYDYSEAYKQAGVKKTYLYSGKYRAMGNDAEPLSDDARAYIQKMLDGIYTIFVDSVARNRNTSAETVLKDMADGRMFLAEEAVRAGLIDGVKTLEETVEYAAKMSDDDMYSA